MNRIELQIDLNYEIAEPGVDFVFNIHAAHTPSQTLSAERLVLNQSHRTADAHRPGHRQPVHAVCAPSLGGLRCRMPWSWISGITAAIRRSLKKCPFAVFRPR